MWGFPLFEGTGNEFTLIPLHIIVDTDTMWSDRTMWIDA